MKIAYFSENYKRGGVNTFLKNLTSKKISTDIIYLIYNKDNPGIKYIKKNCVNVKYLHYSIFAWDKIFNKKINYLNLFFYKIIYSFLFPFTFYYQVFRMFSFFKKNNFDKLMIVNGGYPGGDLCLAASIAWKICSNKKPWINFHNFALKKNKFFLLDFYKNQIDKIISKSVMGFISVSKICSKSIKKRKFLKNIRTVTIYNGHRFNKKKKTFNLKKKFKLPKNSKILLMLAEYDIRKGYEFMFKVMNEINKINKKIYLIAYGFGDSQIQKKIASNFISYKNIFLNNFSENNYQLLAQCDILVVPSQEYESFGYTAIEAMSLKKPIVSTNCGGLVEIIKNNKSGYIVDKNNQKLFAKKILNLLDNKVLMNSFGKQSYKRYKKYFTQEKMQRSYINLIKSNNI